MAKDTAGQEAGQSAALARETRIRSRTSGFPGTRRCWVQTAWTHQRALAKERDPSRTTEPGTSSARSPGLRNRTGSCSAGDNPARTGSEAPQAHFRRAGRPGRARADLGDLGVAHAARSPNGAERARGVGAETARLGATGTWSSGRYHAGDQVARTFSDHSGQRVIALAGLPATVASSRRDGDQFAVFVEAGRTSRWDSIDIVPHATVQYQHLTEDA